MKDELNHFIFHRSAFIVLKSLRRMLDLGRLEIG
jgi:hypothetical protein